MRHIRLVRAVNQPGNRGPDRGMYALQKALREANFPWLKIGGQLEPTDIPWFWLFKDSELATHYAAMEFPFILGPNVFFLKSENPGGGKYEKLLLDAASCCGIVTESPWYARLIQAHVDHNEAPIHLFSYPISDPPDGPLPATNDVLIYLKDRTLGREAIRATEHFRHHITVVYGHYERTSFLEAARRSKVCLYLCGDDRGPLAAMEIAMAGCPLVGIEHGCPWVCETGLGVEVEHWGNHGWIDACEKAMTMDRESVRAVAMDRFSSARSVDAVRAALEPIACGA